MTDLEMTRLCAQAMKTDYVSGSSDNLNRAIVECVAKMQTAKVKP